MPLGESLNFSSANEPSDPISESKSLQDMNEQHKSEVVRVQSIKSIKRMVQIACREGQIKRSNSFSDHESKSYVNDLIMETHKILSMDKRKNKICCSRVQNLRPDQVAKIS